MTRSRYEQGDRVEVYSETKQAWMAGMVVAVDGRKIMVQYQERSKIVDLVSGRFHIVVCGRLDRDLPICCVFWSRNNGVETPGAGRTLPGARLPLSSAPRPGPARAAGQPPHRTRRERGAHTVIHSYFFVRGQVKTMGLIIRTTD
jgi:hypothetical protein